MTIRTKTAIFSLQNDYYAENDGILNRAIIIAKDPTPYTVGLSNELARLESSTDLNIQDSILWKFINRRFNDNKPFEKEVLEVLPLNEEQEKAVRSALSADVTLISGPPGVSGIVMAKLISWSCGKARIWEIGLWVKTQAALRAVRMSPSERYGRRSEQGTSLASARTSVIPLMSCSCCEKSLSAIQRKVN